MFFTHRRMQPMLAVLCAGCMTIATQAGAQSADHWP
ncbi:MAG TPA: MFS transporter, partial [Cupriavidus sp.]|nr:MFS transporter [Cupriavidus sp.]